MNGLSRAAPQGTGKIDRDLALAAARLAKKDDVFLSFDLLQNLLKHGTPLLHSACRSRNGDGQVFFFCAGTARGHYDWAARADHKACHLRAAAHGEDFAHDVSGVDVRCDQNVRVPGDRAFKALEVSNLTAQS